eukprot:1823813-Rhodomonas_salina.1
MLPILTSFVAGAENGTDLGSRFRSLSPYNAETRYRILTFRFGVQIGSKLSLSASAAVQDKLSSVVGWWGGGGGGGAGAEGGGEEGTEEAGERTEVAPGGVEEQNNLL